MKRYPLIMAAAVLAVSESTLASSPVGVNWRLGFQLLPGMNTRQSGSTARAPRLKRSGRTVYLNSTPRHRPAEITLNGDGVSAGAFIRNGKTYVALRQFLKELGETYDLELSVDYLGNGQVSVRGLESGSGRQPNTESRFGLAVAALWEGKIDVSLNHLEHLTKLQTDLGRDARDLAEWLKGCGVVRFSWWHMPEDVEVFIDDEPVVRGCLLAAEAVGDHRLRLVSGGAEIWSGRFRVTDKQAYIVQFGVAGSKPLGGNSPAGRM